jgi:hypothetical protein
MTNLTQDESKLLTAISGGEWVPIVQGMADRGMVEVQVRRTGNTVRVPRRRWGGAGG